MTNGIRSIAIAALAAIVLPAAGASEKSIVTLSAVEETSATKADLDLQTLKLIEKRTVDLFLSKAKASLRAKGFSDGDLPRLQVDSHYVDTQGQRLAIVKLRSGKLVNNVFLYGIVGSEFRRVICVRTTDIEESIPVTYGPCGAKVKEVFGIEIAPN